MSTSTPSSSPSQMRYPHLPKKLILTSTKSYFSPDRTLQYLHDLLDPKNGIFPVPLPNDDILFGLIPDFLTIYPCAQILAGHSRQPTTTLPFSRSSSWPIALGAQDCFWSASYGAYTGEVVPAALSVLGVSIVELGHAERRKLLSETDETTAAKVRAVAESGMVPLVCIGEVESPEAETKTEMGTGTGTEQGQQQQRNEATTTTTTTTTTSKAMAALTPQISSALSALTAASSSAPIIFAYEPVWAIGAAQPASVEYVVAVAQAIRKTVEELDTTLGRTGPTRVVYGGSAGPGLWSRTATASDTNANANANTDTNTTSTNDEKLGLRMCDHLDGMFLGRFAHDVAGVKKVVDEFVQTLE